MIYYVLLVIKVQAQKNVGVKKGYTKPFTSDGLAAHLDDREDCSIHFGIRHYLHMKYCDDDYGMGNKAIYKKGSVKYKIAEDNQTRKTQK